MNALLVLEAMLTVLAVAIVFVAPLDESERCRTIWRRFGRLARRRALSAILVGLLALTLRVAILPLMPMPEPQIHDEFSYLLAAETFASGRLTNPPHPLWPHFETFHVNQQPTYASKYPPAQGLVLATGKVLAGHPWFGVLVSVSLMCTALCWMLQGWLPARWALLGGLIAVIRIATFSYWVNSYWGGAVAAAGGVMVLGALPRLLRPTPRLRNTLALAFGVIILANSRPYEGAILCIPVAVALLNANLKRRPFYARSLINSHMLLLFLLIITVAVMMGYYCWRVTGSPFRMPYQINQDAYAMGQPFLWQSPRAALQYRHQEMRSFYLWELQPYANARGSLMGFLDSAATKLKITWLFYFGPLLTVPLISFPRAVLDRRMRLLVITGGLAVLGLLSETWLQPHYVAPFMGVIYALLLQSMRHLRFWQWRGRSVGRSVVLIVPLMSVAMFVLALINLPRVPVQGRSFEAWCCAQTGPSDRSRLLVSLDAQGGRHLVIVRYDAGHDVHTEWVYNEADIDNAQVVFARDMGATENAALIEYFNDRKVWLLEADHVPLGLKSYH